jgi:hypothetical protein
MSNQENTTIKYWETNGIPVCPFCQKPTKRTGGGHSFTTLAYFPPQYDENGVNTNPDRNITTRSWQCLECGNRYRTKGNNIEGFHYVILTSKQ